MIDEREKEHKHVTLSKRVGVGKTKRLRKQADLSVFCVIFVAILLEEGAGGRL